ncbi:hypothetical protein LINPERPRIM_LOCUS20210 [Linum perenne]
MKNKSVVASKGKATIAGKKVEHSDECFHCKQKGHWKRNCPKYLEDLKNGSSTSTGILSYNDKSTNSTSLVYRY